LQADPALSARLGLPSSAVLTVPAITTDPEMVTALTGAAGGPWAVEHLEAAAVALACAAVGVPFACALGIANRVGPDAHAEWLANRAAAEAGARAAAARAQSS
jgi:purine-nucleoside phosphorylase